MPMMPIRDVSLHVETFGHGDPLVVMHGGPGADMYTMLPFRRCADDHTVIFYDHRCNGRSTGEQETMTWDNLTADADSLREELGFDRWAVLGHSFGGYVALEYALRYPDRLSHLILLDSAGDAFWCRQNAADIMARRGFPPEKVELVRRWFNGEFEPKEMLPIFIRIGEAYSYRTGLPFLWRTALEALHGGWRSKLRPEALIFAGRHLLDGWSVMGRLGEIATPTLVMGGRQDFVNPPEHQAQLAAGIPEAHLHIVERAGHNPHSERTEEVMSATRAFLGTDAPIPASTR
jgi:proline-specific peptidase